MGEFIFNIPRPLVGFKEAVVAFLTTKNPDLVQIGVRFSDFFIL